MVTRIFVAYFTFNYPIYLVIRRNQLIGNSVVIKL